MAEDAAELLLEGIDKIVDKHFDKTWDKTKELKQKRKDKKRGSPGDKNSTRRSSDRSNDSPPSRAPPPRDSRSDWRRDDPQYSPTSRRSRDSDPRLGSKGGVLETTSSRGSRNDAAYAPEDYDTRRGSSRRYSSADRDPGYRSSPPRRSSSLRSSREYERDRARREQRRSRDDYGKTSRYPPPADSNRARYPDDPNYRSSGGRGRYDDDRSSQPSYRYSGEAKQRPQL